MSQQGKTKAKSLLDFYT